MNFTTHQYAYLNQIKTHLPLIKQDAETAEKQGHLTDDVLNAIYGLRLFRVFISENYNGAPQDLVTALKAFELIATADGATGWLVMIGAGGGLFSGFIEPKAAKEIFEPERAVIAGSGMPSGSVSSEGNGFVAKGRWAYASGAYHATWFTANCLVEGTENDIIAIAVPADQVTIHETWSVFGMKGTGSHDFSVDNTSLPKSHTFSLFEHPILDEPIYHCPLDTLASVTFASVGIGIAQHCLEAFNDFAKTKSVLGSEARLIEDKGVKQRVVQAEQLISDARSQLYTLATQVWYTLEKGSPPDADLKKKVQKSCVEMVQNCIKAANLLKARAGMMAVFEASEFGRAWRDLQVLSQHAMLSPY